MSRVQIYKALERLVRFKRSRVNAGLWGNAEGNVVIDKMLKAFGVKE
jgi:hypothetical protein